MKTWLRRTFVLFLFAALVVVLLWFQGIVLRDHPEAAEAPAPPALDAGDALATVERRTLSEDRVYPGFVEPVDPADLAPRVMAAVLEVTVREGDAVAAGQVVARLDDRDARTRLSQAESARTAAAARALQARLAFERAERLLAAEAVTLQEWEAARAARDGADALEEQAGQAVEEARTALSWFELTAPFAGRVLARHADPGQLATPGRPVVTLYRTDRLRFRVAVPEELVAELSAEPAADHPSELAVGQTRAVDFDGLPARSARIARLLPASDPATGTVVLHLELEPAPDLRPGLLGRLLLPAGERSALVVPAAAVERIGQIERVRLARDRTVVPVTVRTGKAHGDVVEVLSGLLEGERVVLP